MQRPISKGFTKSQSIKFWENKWLKRKLPQFKTKSSNSTFSNRRSPNWRKQFDQNKENDCSKCLIKKSEDIWLANNLTYSWLRLDLSSLGSNKSEISSQNRPSLTAPMGNYTKIIMCDCRTMDCNMSKLKAGGKTMESMRKWYEWTRLFWNRSIRKRISIAFRKMWRLINCSILMRYKISWMQTKFF